MKQQLLPTLGMLHTASATALLRVTVIEYSMMFTRVNTSSPTTNSPHWTTIPPLLTTPTFSRGAVRCLLERENILAVAALMRQRATLVSLLELTITNVGMPVMEQEAAIILVFVMTAVLLETPLICPNVARLRALLFLKMTYGFLLVRLTFIMSLPVLYIIML